MEMISLMSFEDHAGIFAAEVSPKIYLRDPAGNQHPIVDASRASTAIELADELYAMGGATKFVTYGNDGKRSAESLNFSQSSGEDAQSFLLFYTSKALRPTKGEIARAAKVIARSELRPTVENSISVAIVGKRSIVYPELAPQRTNAIPFLLSNMVFYSANRATAGFPSNDDQLQMVVDDINARLVEGQVSILR